MQQQQISSSPATTVAGTLIDNEGVSVHLTAYRKIFARPSWHSLGACRNRPTAWWFSNNQTEQMAAMIVCRELCPVRWKCLADNLDVPLGIFGGFNADERRVIRNQYSVLVDPELLRLTMETE